MTWTWHMSFFTSPSLFPSLFLSLWQIKISPAHLCLNLSSRWHFKIRFHCTLHITTPLTPLSSVIHLSYAHTLKHSCHGHTRCLTADILIRFGLYGECVVIELPVRLSHYTHTHTSTTSVSSTTQDPTAKSGVGKKHWHVKRRRGRPVWVGLVVAVCAGVGHLCPFLFKIYRPLMLNYIISQQKLC